MDINKEKCKTLKQIRKKLADTLDIDLHQTECTYEGACSGTCPKCKQEEQQLNRAILAKSAMAAGVAAMAVGLTGCTQTVELEGDVVQVTESNSSESFPEELEGDTEELMTGEVLEPEDTTGTYELEGDIVIIDEASTNE